MVIGGDDIKNEPCNWRVLSLIFNVCLHSSSFSLRADWRKSTSSVDGMPQGGGIKISETQLH